MADLFLKIINMSISSSWMVIVVLVLRFCFKKIPKWISCILWGIVGLRFIMPFSVESIFSLIPSEETISKVPDAPRPYFESGIKMIDNSINAYINATYFEGVSKPMGYFTDVATILGCIWMLGILLLLIYFFISFVCLQKKVCTAVHLSENIYQSEADVSPFILGIVKPRIYLPISMEEQDMKHVIAHEQAHIKRKDHWWKPLGFLVLTLHWFNPLVWLAYVLLCRDIELACDEKVVKELNGEQRADYAQALLTCSVERHMVAACPLAFGEVGVKDRVKSVLNYKKPTFGVVIVGIVISTIFAVCFLTNPMDTNEYVIETIQGDRLTYYQMSNGTWKVDGHTYKYRLELSGRPPKAIRDVTYVYLSNIENITFEQAEKAAGLGSNTDDYFDVEEAVLVEMR